MTGFSERPSSRHAYRAGLGLAFLTSFATVWTTIVRDDGNGLGFLMLVMAAAVGSFAARLRSADMARAMVGVAIMQVLLAIALATEPSTLDRPDGSLTTLFACAVCAALWLISANFFRLAAKQDHKAPRRQEAEPARFGS